MQVTKEHIVDKGPVNERGLYAYYYEYDLYKFQEDEVVYTARSYIDESEDVSFLGASVNDTRRFMDEADFQTPLFKEAVNYLKAEGKTRIAYLAEDGYRLLFGERRVR